MRVVAFCVSRAKSALVSEPPVASKDPRFRSYRIAMYALYIGVVSAFSLIIILSVVKSVMVMSPRRAPDTDTVLTPRECVDHAGALWRELDTRRQEITSQGPARRVDEQWTTFRVQWMTKFRRIESQCALESQNRAELKKLFGRLESVNDLFTTHSVQYAGEIGPVVDELQAALEAMRKQTGRF